MSINVEYKTTENHRALGQITYSCNANDDNNNSRFFRKLKKKACNNQEEIFVVYYIFYQETLTNDSEMMNL